MSPDPQDQPERSALLELRERKGSLGIQERWASRGPQAEPLDRREPPERWAPRGHKASQVQPERSDLLGRLVRRELSVRRGLPLPELKVPPAPLDPLERLAPPAQSVRPERRVQQELSVPPEPWDLPAHWAQRVRSAPQGLWDPRELPLAI